MQRSSQGKWDPIECIALQQMAENHEDGDGKSYIGVAKAEKETPADKDLRQHTVWRAGHIGYKLGESFISHHPHRKNRCNFFHYAQFTFIQALDRHLNRQRLPQWTFDGPSPQSPMKATQTNKQHQCWLARPLHHSWDRRGFLTIF